MKEDKRIKAHRKFLAFHKIKYYKKKKKWSKPFHMVLKTVWVKSEKGSYNKEKKEKGYLQNKFVKWKLGQDTTRLTKCAYCFKELRGKQRKYCSRKCTVLATHIKNKVKEFGRNHSIIHFEKNDGFGHLLFPEWKDFWVTYPDVTYKQLTKKRGKLNRIIES